MDRWLRYFTKEEVAGFKNAENLYGKAYLISVYGTFSSRGW